jgi:hypothetical protein
MRGEGSPGIESGQRNAFRVPHQPPEPAPLRVLPCRRRDSNPRHADYDSGPLRRGHRECRPGWTRRWTHPQVRLHPSPGFVPIVSRARKMPPSPMRGASWKGQKRLGGRDLLEAADGTRTHDLLHDKQSYSARVEWVFYLQHNIHATARSERGLPGFIAFRRGSVNYSSTAWSGTTSGRDWAMVAARLERDLGFPSSRRGPQRAPTKEFGAGGQCRLRLR